MIAPDAFQRASVEAAREFLQTVVVVDNRAGFGLDEADIPRSDLEPPDEFAAGPAADAPETTTSGQVDGFLDATELSRAFACQKLVCAILKPSPDDRMERAVRHAAHRADMLVLDWQMNDDGELAASIIDGVLDDDGGEGRLRLIAIYTSQSPLSGVADSLGGKVLRLVREGLAFRNMSTRVIFLSKGNSANAPEERDRAVEEGELPERLLHEFASHAQGLLSNATMAAIGGIRDHTHRILARFEPTMDGPLLTHRTLLSSPDDADEFAADLIMAELQAQIPIRSIVSRFLGPQRVREFVEHRVANGQEPKVILNKGANPKTFTLDLAQTCDLVELGLNALVPLMPALTKAQNGKTEAAAVDKFKSTMKEELHERLYMLFDRDMATARRHHDEFAVRSKIRRDATALPANWTPRLRLGSLVARGDEIWMCVTPNCDSIRIPKAGGSFLFAELSKPARGRFDLVVPQGGDHQRLELARKRTRMVSLGLTPDANGDVTATKKGDLFLFEATTSGTSATETLTWLAELKPMHAQRLVQRYASNLSRVAVDDFEWHRVQMDGGLDA